MKYFVLCLTLCLASCVAAKNDPWVGDWIGVEEGTRRTSMTLRANGTFSLGDIVDDREFPDGVTGTWKVQNDCLLLKTRTSESCKIRDGEELRFLVRLSGDGKRLVGDPGGETVFQRRVTR